MEHLGSTALIRVGHIRGLDIAAGREFYVVAPSLIDHEMDVATWFYMANSSNCCPPKKECAWEFRVNGLHSLAVHEEENMVVVWPSSLHGNAWSNVAEISKV